MPSYSGVWSLPAVYQAVAQGNWPEILKGDIGIFGFSGNTLNYVSIASTGNAADFGDLTNDNQRGAACSGNGLGVWAGGEAGGAYSGMQQITIASTGNATNFGNLTVARYDLAGLSNGNGGLA